MPAEPDRATIARSSAIAVVGAGSIGISWALVFARAGHSTALHDSDRCRLRDAGSELRARADALASAGLINEAPTELLGCVSLQPGLEQALSGAVHIQECVSEDLELKRSLFTRVEGVAAPGAVIASSTSAMLPTELFEWLATRSRCLVAHPVNPPHLIPIVELVPAPFTDQSTVNAVAQLLSTAGMVPIRIGAEIEGFVFNRLQGAVLREAYCLVRDGIASVEDVDRVVREALGFRWAIAGPFETADLNMRGGITVHAERIGPAYARMGAARGQDDPWSDELVEMVARQRRASLPLDSWEARVAWRDQRLIELKQALGAGG